MDEILSTDCCRAAIAAALPTLADMAARERIAAALVAAGRDPGAVSWSDRPADARTFAEHLERLFVGTEENYPAYGLIDSATMIRVNAGGEALAGEPLEWRELGGKQGCVAKGPTGTRWDVYAAGSGWGIVIADWDRPDWVTSGYERAKRIAEQIDARPNFSKQPGMIDLPFD